jgi:hypothetical protein
MSTVTRRVSSPGAFFADDRRVPGCVGECDLTSLRIRSWRVTIFGVRECAECGQRLRRALPGAGRPMAYCSPACRQRAYRRRGGQASGTTGAERRRRERWTG